MGNKQNNKKPIMEKKEEIPENQSELQKIQIISNKLHCGYSKDYAFTFFNTIKGDTILVYLTINYILCGDIKKNLLLKKIKVEINDISSIKHYLDTNNNKDILITTSVKTIKLYDINNKFNIISNIQYIGDDKGALTSSCLLCNELNKTNYIISAGANHYIKVYDFNGKFLRNFEDKVLSNVIEPYYDKKTNQYYIVNANYDNVKSYIFETGKIYKTYQKGDKTAHFFMLIKELKNKTIIIESGNNGYIKFWDFHSGNLILGIRLEYELLSGLCLWDDNYLLCGDWRKKINLIDLKEGKCIKRIEGHYNYVCRIEKINHPLYGICLLSNDYDGNLILWKVVIKK